MREITEQTSVGTQPNELAPKLIRDAAGAAEDSREESRRYGGDACNCSMGHEGRVLGPNWPFWVK
jgi:hypothetical protein